MRTVAIIYGWAEGSWQGKKFRKELESRGFEVISDPMSADIIIGHSLGCYLVPPEVRNKDILLIGLPYWPGRGVFKSVVMKLRNEINYHRRNKGLGWWLRKMLHNTYYILSRPHLSYYGSVRRGVQYLPNGTHNRVTIARPSNDTFCHPGILQILPKASGYRLVGIPGAHDDCWFKPQPYIDLLLKEL